jgi:DNA-binding transcriptional ArsR family regulator
MGSQANRWLDNVRDLRAMAHPLRVRLYYVLSAEEAATASRLAEVVGESPALVSYHLRQLREHGFVEEAPDLVTDRRERWWRPSTSGFSYSLTEAGDEPETRAAASTLQRVALQNQLEALQRFRDEQPAWGAAWSDAAFSSDSLLRLTPGEMEAMSEEIQAVLQRWRHRGREAAADERDVAQAVDGRGEVAEPSGREHVMVFMHGFPFRL